MGVAPNVAPWASHATADPTAHDEQGEGDTMSRSWFAKLVAGATMAVAVWSCTAKTEGGEAVADRPTHVAHDVLKKEIARYAQVNISYDESVLTDAEKRALESLVQAAGVMDEIFLRQVWSGNPELRQKLVHWMATDAAQKDLARDLNHFFQINFGPWNRLEHNRPFIGALEKPLGAGYYPENMTKEEFEKACADRPGEAAAMRDFFTRIERADDGTLRAVPYSEAYADLLAQAKAHLETAAGILEGAQGLPEGVNYGTLAAYLRSRAAAFASNDYFQSDMDWMDVRDNIVDVTIGPYETYEDELFGYKAAFEAFIAIRNPADSRQLADLKNYLPRMEMNLPIPDAHKNMGRGTESPISVVDVVFIGGDSKAGVQTIAFNLPNDERVRNAKGSKKVMLKNLSQAKYDKILVPIAGLVLDEKQLPQVNFASYFSNVLMHELAHGLGPGTIKLSDGTETTVGQTLRDRYSALEEAKADIMGLYNKAFLAKEGYIDRAELDRSYVCFLPGFFRAIRFGVHEAHGKANMIEYNYLKEKGAIVLDPATDRYRVVLDKMPAAVEALTHDLCMIQARGDYDGAGAFIEKYAAVPEEVERQLQKLGDIPTDIEPVYRAARHLSG